MLKLLDTITLGMSALLLDTIIVSEEIVTIRLELIQLRGIHVIDILAYKLRVSKRFNLSLKQLYLSIFIINCLFQRFYVSSSLLEQSTLLYSLQMHLLIGKLLSSEDFRDIGEDALILIDYGLSDFRKIEFYSFILGDRKIAEDGVTQATVALHRLSHFSWWNDRNMTV
jgi:hypothetical protein